MFSPLEAKRFSRQTILDEVGLIGQQKLKRARVLVVGAGGIGCPVLQYLNSCGVGTLGIVDFDSVEHSNLHRQVLYGPQDVGRKKVEVAAERLKSQNPDVNIEWFDSTLSIENAEELIAQFDLVVDGCDNFLTRYTVNDSCVKLGKPLVYGSVLGFQGQLTVFNYKGSKNLRDLFPEPPNAEDVPNCSENGVLGSVPGVVGTFMANEVLKLLLGMDVAASEFKIIDLQYFSLTTLRY